MARPRQVKKNRSSRSRVKTGTVGRTKAGKKKVNFLGSETVRENWDRKLTLAQNYANLGLSARLRGRTGGVERQKLTGAPPGEDTLAITSGGVKVGKLAPGEVKVVRDAEGRIIEIIDPHTRRKLDNPLNDPLNDLENDDDDDEDMDEEMESAAAAEEEEEGTTTTQPSKIKTKNPIVAQLEAQAAAEAEEIERKKQPRKQSTREEEWIENLVAKYGDNYTGMFRDRKLNPMQQSEGDIKKRVKRYRALHAG